MKNRKEFKAWLDARRTALADDAAFRREATWLAHRAAMRVLPFAWYWYRRRDLTPIPFLWANLISGVAGTCPTPEIIATAATATVATANATANATATVATAAAAANATAVATATVATATATATVATAAAYAATATAAADANATAADAAADADAADAWAALSEDLTWIVTGDPRDPPPLWPGENPLRPVWQDLRQALTAPAPPGAKPEGWGPSEWRFWITWYDRALTGGPQDWPLLTRIAKIEARVWEGKQKEGEKDLAARIADELFRRDLEQNKDRHPFAWRVSADAQYRIRATPKDQVDVSQIVSEARSTLTNFKRRCKAEKGKSRSNVYEMMEGWFDGAIKELRRKLSKYKDDPAGLYHALDESRYEMQLILKANGCQDDPIAAQMIYRLTVHSQDVCVASPEVMKMVADRKKVKMLQFSEEMMQRALSILRSLEGDSVGDFRSMIAFSAAVLSDPASTDDDRAMALQVYEAGVPRAALAALDRLAMNAKGTKKKKGGAIRQGLSDFVLGERALDAGQEIASEFSQWLEILQQAPLNG